MPLSPILLASASPRRKDILDTAGIPCFVKPVEVSEEFHEGSPDENAQRISRQKAEQAVKTFGTEHIIIAADTFIYQNGKFLGKPMDRDEAFVMLQGLSGKSHSVYTGFSIYEPETECFHGGVDITVVYFSVLSTAEIEHYLKCDEWKDAAGGYKIQGRGGCYITRIDGSYHNVMGLPIHRIYGILSQIHYFIP